MKPFIHGEPGRVRYSCGVRIHLQSILMTERNGLPDWRLNRLLRKFTRRTNLRSLLLPFSTRQELDLSEQKELSHFGDKQKKRREKLQKLKWETNQFSKRPMNGLSYTLIFPRIGNLNVDWVLCAVTPENWLTISELDGYEFHVQTFFTTLCYDWREEEHFGHLLALPFF